MVVLFYKNQEGRQQWYDTLVNVCAIFIYKQNVNLKIYTNLAEQIDVLILHRLLTAFPSIKLHFFPKLEKSNVIFCKEAKN